MEILSVEADFLLGVLMMMLHDKKHFLSHKAVSASDDKCASTIQVITCGTWHLRWEVKRVNFGANMTLKAASVQSLYEQNLLVWLYTLPTDHLIQDEIPTWVCCIGMPIKLKTKILIWDEISTQFKIIVLSWIVILICILICILIFLNNIHMHYITYFFYEKKLFRMLYTKGFTRWRFFFRCVCFSFRSLQGVLLDLSFPRSYSYL